MNSDSQADEIGCESHTTELRYTMNKTIMSTTKHWQPMPWSSQQLIRYDTIWYDTIEEFNVDWKAECDQLNLAQVARNKKYTND